MDSQSASDAVFSESRQVTAEDLRDLDERDG